MYNVPTKISWTLGWMESAPDFNPFFFHGFLVLSNPEVRSIL